MKKLMIAACAVAFAGVVQAANFAWGNSYGLDAANGGGDTKAYDGKIYMMDSSVKSAGDFFAAMYAGGMSAATFNTLVASALNSATLTNTDGGGWFMGSMSDPAVGTVSEGKIIFDSGKADGSNYDVYQVAYDAVAGALYISESISNLTGGDPLITPGAASTDFTNDQAYNGTFFTGATSYQGAGWYQTVPEPTSGLLLLLGVAGLALRRRRA